MRYLTVSELIYINGRLLNNDKILSGRQKVRDLALLEAAVARPASSAFGQDAYPTLAEKAAALFHSVARNHPFTDGNKRTATIAALFMLAINGAQVDWEPEEALAAILAAAEGRMTWEALAAWFPLVASEPAPEAAADADMAIIDRLVRQHEWLIHELESR
jgi:death-on-curing protein